MSAPTSVPLSTLDEPMAVFQFLKNHNLKTVTKKQVISELELPSKERKCLTFVGKLLEFFGSGYAAYCKQNLRDSELKLRLCKMEAVFCEIQNSLSKGKNSYCEDDFPETTAVLELDKEVNPDDLFYGLQRSSYGILPYPQRVVGYPTYDRHLINQIERSREEAFANLNRILIGTKRLLDQKEELQLTQLYWAMGALGNSTYGDIVNEWSQLSSRNAKARDRLTPYLTTSHWMNTQGTSSPQIAPLSPIEEEKTPEPQSPDESNTSIKGYLTQKTIHEVETRFQEWIGTNIPESRHRNIPFQFSDSLKEHLKTLMLRETVRSDFAYFTQHFDLVRSINWEHSKHGTQSLFHAIRVFFDLIQKYEVTGEKYTEILEMLIRCPKLNYTFAESYPNIGAEDPQFVNAWKNFKHLNMLAKTTSHLDSPRSWDLFSFLIKNNGGDVYCCFFSEMSQIERINLSIKIIYSFCRENPELTFSEMNALKENTQKLLKEIEKRGFSYTNAERIFLDPSVNLKDSKVQEVLQSAVDRAQKFMGFVEKYKFSFHLDSVKNLFKNYLFHPRPFLFELLEDVPELGIEDPNGSCLEEVLSDPIELVSEPVLSNASIHPIPLKSSRRELYRNTASAQRRSSHVEESSSKEFFKTRRREAISKVLLIHKKYPLQGAYRFSLYVEFVRLDMDNKSLEIARMAELIYELERFCPGLSTEIIFYLYRYHPKVSSADLNAIRLKKDEYRRQDQNDLIVPKKFYDSLTTEIELFLKRFKVSSNHYDVFYAKMKEALIRSFFPPEQSLTDFFRITGLSCVSGIRWGEEFLATHEGQLRSVFAQSPLKIFVHWQMVAGYPVLFFSFSDDDAAQSAFIPLNIRLGDELTWNFKDSCNAADMEASLVKKNNYRQEFFTYLKSLSYHLMNEEASVEFELPATMIQDGQMVQAPAVPEEENRHRWIHLFPGLYDAIGASSLPEEHKDEIWDFVIRVKKEYRNLYLAQTDHSLISVGPQTSPVYASLGNLWYSENYPQGSLIPPFIREIEPHIEFYSMNLKQDVVKTLSVLFFKSGDFKGLNINNEQHNLVLTHDGINKKEYPLSYKVKTEDDQNRTVMSTVHKRTYSQKALPMNQIKGTYVTLKVPYKSGNEQNSIEWPMHYPLDVLSNQEKFSERFTKHYLYLKAACYFHFEMNRKFPAPKQVHFQDDKSSPSPSPSPSPSNQEIPIESKEETPL